MTSYFRTLRDFCNEVGIILICTHLIFHFEIVFAEIEIRAWDADFISNSIEYMKTRGQLAEHCLVVHYEVALTLILHGFYLSHLLSAGRLQIFLI